jgi:hypothetical protein
MTGLGIQVLLRCSRTDLGARTLLAVFVLAPITVASIAAFHGRLPYARNLLPLLGIWAVVLSLGLSALVGMAERYTKALAIALSVCWVAWSWPPAVAATVTQRLLLAETCPAERAADWLVVAAPGARDRVLEHMFGIRVGWELSRRGFDVSHEPVAEKDYAQPSPGGRLFLLVGDPYPPLLTRFGRASRACCAPEARRILLGDHLVCEQDVAPACDFGTHPSGRLRLERPAP